VQSELSTRELAQVQAEFCSKYKIRVSTKMTEEEYTKRIGFLGRVNQKISLLTWY